MPEVTVVPDGDGTTTDLTVLVGPGNFDDVDEGIAGADDGGTTVSTSGNSSLDDFYTMEDMPGDFDAAVEWDGVLRGQISGVVDDTISLSGAVFETNETTLVAEGALSGNRTWETFTFVSGIASTSSASTWNSRKIRLRSDRSNSGMPDAVTVEFTAVEIVITYATAAAPDEEWAGTQQPAPFPAAYLRPVGVVSGSPGV